MRSKSSNIWMHIVTIIIVVIIFMAIFSLYVYVGTYVFPIAPYWITQLPPNPPKPTIKYGEFYFELEYEFLGERKATTGTLICEFEGFKVYSFAGEKKLQWSEYYKNTGENKIFSFKDGEDGTQWIVLEEIEPYKIVLSVGEAEDFLSKSEKSTALRLPEIQVYDMVTGYFEYPVDRERILKEYGFKISKWICDNPIKNEYH